MKYPSIHSVRHSHGVENVTEANLHLDVPDPIHSTTCHFHTFLSPHIILHLYLSQRSMARQSFNDFLNSPGPSTPRGRGRGRGGGRGGGGRGGPTGGGGGRSSFTTDYSNVPLDYAQLSGRKYTKMDGESRDINCNAIRPRESAVVIAHSSSCTLLTR